MCLLLGPSGVGKTLLLKRMHACSMKGSYSVTDELPSTIPTVGTNLVNIATQRKHEVTVRELGGAMAPIWRSYFADCNAVIMMMDVSNRAQLAASCMQFYEILTHEALQKCHVLLLLNKTDLPGAVSSAELGFILRLDEIKKISRHTIQTLECSAKAGTNLKEIARWIQDHCKPNS